MSQFEYQAEAFKFEEPSETLKHKMLRAKQSAKRPTYARFENSPAASEFSLYAKSQSSNSAVSESQSTDDSDNEKRMDTAQGRHSPDSTTFTPGSLTASCGRAVTPFAYGVPPQAQAQAQAHKGAAKKTNIDQSKYKTEICRNWQLQQSCHYGDRCRYAHGHEELKTKSNINQYYKTRRCTLYHNDGYCSYGTRCHFIHEDRTLETIQSASTVAYQDLLAHGVASNKRLPIFRTICGTPNSDASGSDTSSESGCVSDCDSVRARLDFAMVAPVNFAQAVAFAPLMSVAAPYYI